MGCRPPRSEWSSIDRQASRHRLAADRAHKSAPADVSLLCPSGCPASSRSLVFGSTPVDVIVLLGAAIEMPRFRPARFFQSRASSKLPNLSLVMMSFGGSSLGKGCHRRCSSRLEATSACNHATPMCSYHRTMTAIRPARCSAVSGVAPDAVLPAAGTLFPADVQPATMSAS